MNATASPPSTEDIAVRAYQIYEAEGCPEGRALEHWRQAEDELCGWRPGSREDMPEDE